MKKFKVAVLGDSFLDKFSFYDSFRNSPEADVPVAINEDIKYFPGGAALVSSILSKNRILVDLYTRIGSNKNSVKLLNLLKNFDINLIDYSYNFETIVKDRKILNNQYFLRTDNEIISDLTHEDELIADFSKNLNKYDFVILSDYAKGFFTKKVANNLSKLNLKEKSIIDPKPSGHLNFKNCTFLKPNYKEGVILSSNKKPNKIVEALNNKFETNTILTHGSKGVYFQNTANQKVERLVPKKLTTVVDSSGSGDIFLANFISEYLTSKNIESSINFAMDKTLMPLKQFGYW